MHAQEVADALDVPAASYPGLLRLLDDLVFEGVASSQGGERFVMEGPRSVRDARDTRNAKVPGPAASKVAKPNKAASKSTPPAAKSTTPSTPAPKVMPKTTSKPMKGLPPKAAKPSVEKKRGREGERRDGVLTVNPRGFGFVASPAAAGDNVYIAPEYIGNAMQGDQVVIEIVARGSRGAEGRIVEIKARGAQRVSGILRRRGKNAWIDPDDPRVRGPVVLSREIDQTGGEGNSGIDGQVVVVQITRFPETADENPEGKLLAVLGAPGDIEVEVRKVLLLANVDEVHSQTAIDEAEAYGLEVPASMLEGREDLTHVPLPTIDPEDARDHDDAVWVQRTQGGGYEVWVAIADVSSYVRIGTKIDEEARTRGCSIYLPDRAIPMLPRALSSNLCSLLPDVVRLCLCVHAELDAKGNVIKTRVIRGFMKSAAKLTYGGVARALGYTTEPPVQPKAEEMVDDLRVAAECSRLLRNKRMKRGALDFDLPEPVVKLDAEGKPYEIKKRANDPGVKKAYQLIEELMIFANEVVARYLLENEWPGVYRVHLPPDPKKLDRLAAMCELLGVEFDAEATQSPKGLAELLKSFSKHPLANVLNSLLLRSMKQATYDVSNLGHFGLASDAYLHFTSPIRRYPDLVVHRVIHAALERDSKTRHKALRQAGDPEKLAEAAMQSSLAERRAMEVEREILDIYRCFYMIDRIGETYEGTVSAFVGAGAFITIDEPFVDVMMRTEDMGPDFVVDEDGLAARGVRSGDRIQLGDSILAKVTDVAILRRTIYVRRPHTVGRDDGSREEPRRGPRGQNGFDTPKRPYKSEGTFGNDRKDSGKSGRFGKSETFGKFGKPGQSSKLGKRDEGAKFGKPQQGKKAGGKKGNAGRKGKKR